MRKLAKRLWLLFFVAIILTITVVSCYDERLAFDIVRSIANGETSIGFWMKHGTTFTDAVIIAIICSTYDISSWLYLFNSVHNKWEKTDSQILRFFHDRIETAVKNCKNFWWLAKKTYQFCVPQPSKIFKDYDAETPKDRRRCYYPLAFYGFFPGYIWTGIGYGIIFQLNQSAVFLILSFFNAIKMICAGYLTLRIGVWGVLFVIITMPFAKYGVEKLLRAIKK